MTLTEKRTNETNPKPSGGQKHHAGKTLQKTDDPDEIEINIGETEQQFINVLKELPDTRDNRGKRHSLVMLIVTVVFATLVSRSKVSSIHRYMDNKIQWLREITGAHNGKVLRGTLKSGKKQAIIHAVSHESRIDVAQACQAGDKSSEITVMCQHYMPNTIYAAFGFARILITGSGLAPAFDVKSLNDDAST